MEVNKDESDRCIHIALKAVSAGDLEKAKRLLKKSNSLYPNNKAKELLQTLSRNGVSDSSTTTSSSNNHSNDARSRDDVTVEPTYTQDQVDLVNQINSSKDYYQILSIGKDADDIELKKAYRKLALKLHPDKNSAPGATESFKAVGNAYAVLSNKDKRLRYDKYGDEDVQVRQRRANRQGDYYTYDFSRGFQCDIDPDDLFNMFFGNGFPSTHVRTHNSTNGRNSSYQQAERRGNYAFLMQLVPFMMLILVSFFSTLWVQEPIYSFQYRSPYTVPMRTKRMDIVYYVKRDYQQTYKGSTIGLERSVEDDYVVNLQEHCFKEQQIKEGLLMKAEWMRDGKLYEDAKSRKLPNCDKLQKLKTRSRG